MAHVHYKPIETLTLREIPTTSVLELQNKRKKKLSNQHSQAFRTSLGHLALEFGRNSSVHTMNRIFQQHSNKYERCFWFLIFASAFFTSIYVCIILSKRYNAANIQTVVRTTNKPVFEIYFPKVVICNKNNLNWDRIGAAKARFMPNETNAEKIRVFELVTSLYDNLQFGYFNVFKKLEGQPISLVRNINFSLVYEFMTWRCEEMLTNCVWRYMKVNCCDIFVRDRGLAGLCWHFNSLTTHEGKERARVNKKYPWRSGGFGQKSGLSVRVLINDNKHYHKDNDKGLWISVMEPDVFHKDLYSLTSNSQTLVIVDPVLYVYDNNTRDLSPSIRRCLFKDERTSNYDSIQLANFTYMVENCETECRQEHLLRYCNCTMDLLFPQGTYRSCTVDDLLCLANNNKYLQFIEQEGEEQFVDNEYRIICKCVRNCYSLRYMADVKPFYMPKYLRGEIMFNDLDIYYRYNRMMIYHTSLVFGWVDLLVAFGGIAGLFLGCSFISGIEVMYFALVELPLFMFIRGRNRSKITAGNRQLNGEFQSHHPTFKRCNWGMNNRLKVARCFQNYDTSLYEARACDVRKQRF